MKKKINKYSKHELLDRTNVIVDNFDTFILSHQDFKKLSKKSKKKAKKAFNSLWEVYKDFSNL